MSIENMSSNMQAKKRDALDRFFRNTVPPIRCSTRRSGVTNSIEQGYNATGELKYSTHTSIAWKHVSFERIISRVQVASMVASLVVVYLDPSA